MVRDEVSKANAKNVGFKYLSYLRDAESVFHT